MNDAEELRRSGQYGGVGEEVLFQFPQATNEELAMLGISPGE